jgi:hypothetical protein
MSLGDECERQAAQAGYRGSDRDRAVDLCVDYEKRFGSPAIGDLQAVNVASATSS